MAFSDAFLEELSARADIVDLVSRHVELKKQGGRLVGLCPFHSEKTPSFSVSPDKQLFYCFGCGAGGGAIQFAMRMENLPFADAVRALADRAGLTIPEEASDREAMERRETLYRLNREAARFFHQNLKGPGGAKARDYLQKRNLSPAAVTHFGLGFAPDDWDGLLKAMTAAGFAKADLLSAGLVVAGKTGSLYDRFRGRLIFPIIDLRKRVVGFGGRVLDDSLPKYLNSPDTPVFSKSQNLFALFLAKNTKQGRLILAEGYMDVVSLHQAGFDCAVASLGTALTPQQAMLMAKYTREVVISYDMDAAGQKAAARAIGILEQAGVSIRVLRMKGAKDPDEYIGRFGREAFAALLTGAETQTEYRLSALAGQHDLTADEGRLNFCREAALMLAAIPSNAERDIFTVRAAELSRVAPDALKSDVRRARARLGKQAGRDAARKAARPEQALQPADRALRYENTHSASAEEGLLQMVFADPALLTEAAELVCPEDFSAPLLGKLFAFALAHPDDPGLAFAAGAFAPEELSHLARLIHKPSDVAAGPQAVRDCAGIIRDESGLRRAVAEGADPLLIYRQSRRESIQ
ncbi:MAG: DNA primase [Oscillospiraceae bacterium]|jgi:DNA primase|nr:DNA primase [Oscillospiraceae bacterium]